MPKKAELERVWDLATTTQLLTRAHDDIIAVEAEECVTSYCPMVNYK